MTANSPQPNAMDLIYGQALRDLGAQLGSTLVDAAVERAHRLYLTGHLVLSDEPEAQSESNGDRSSEQPTQDQSADQDDRETKPDPTPPLA